MLLAFDPHLMIACQRATDPYVVKPVRPVQCGLNDPSKCFCCSLARYVTPVTFPFTGIGGKVGMMILLLKDPYSGTSPTPPL